jgi:hypothetical protein
MIVLNSITNPFCERSSVDNRTMSGRVVVDYDGEGHSVKIDIDNAGSSVSLSRVRFM